MPCVKCNGYWQCSKDGVPCQAANEPIEVEKHCFQVLTKKEYDDCKMKIKTTEEGPSGEGWDDAGTLCVEFKLFVDGDGKCFVKAEIVDS